MIAGLLLSSVSIAESTGAASLSGLVTPYTVTGAGILFVSILFAAITYTSTSIRVGIAADSADNILDPTFDYDIVQEEVALAYASMIDHNYRKNATNAFLFALTLLTAVVAVVYLTVGIVDLYNESIVEPGLNLVLVGFVAAFGRASGAFGTARRWWRLTSPRALFVSWIVTRSDRWMTLPGKRNSASEDEDT